MSKLSRKKGSTISPLVSIIVYNDDKKCIEEFKLNDEQKLLIPIKSKRRKLKQKVKPKDKSKNKNKDNDSNNDIFINNKNHFKYTHQVIYSKPEGKKDIIADLTLPFNEKSSDSFFDDEIDDEIYGF